MMRERRVKLIRFVVLFAVLFVGFGTLRPVVAQSRREFSQLRARIRGADLNLVLMSNDEIQDEIDLSRRQAMLLEALDEDLRTQWSRSGRGRNRGKRSELEQRKRTTLKLYKVILKADQFNRLTQIRRQFEGLYAADDAEFANDIELAKTDLAVLKDLRTQGEDPSIYRKSVEPVLDSKKLAKWKELLGEEYEFSEELSEFRRFYLSARRGENDTDR